MVKEGGVRVGDKGGDAEALVCSNRNMWSRRRWMEKKEKGKKEEVEDNEKRKEEEQGVAGEVEEKKR